MDAYDQLKKLAVDGFERYEVFRRELESEPGAEEELSQMWDTIEAIDQVRALATEGRAAEKLKCAMMLEWFFDWHEVWDDEEMKKIHVLVDKVKSM